MSSERASDEFLRQVGERMGRAAKDPSPIGDPGYASAMASAVKELIQRRKDGVSPEEFVVLMAERVGDIKPEFQAHYLQCLAEIRRATTCLRQYVAGKVDG